MDSKRLTEVVSHALQLTGQLDRDAAYQHFVDSARHLTGARYAALAVLDSHGETMEFIQSGMDPHAAHMLGRPPRGHGVFADTPVKGWLIVNDLESYLHRYGFPEGHPVMRNYLGVAVSIREQVWGRLYLTDKLGGFTDDDGAQMEILAQAAAIAAQNSQMFARSQNRARWLTASQNIVSSLLEGSEEDEALQVIVHEMRIAAQADAAIMVLPSIQDTWVSEIVDGEDADHLLGIRFPAAGRAMTVVNEQAGLVVDSMQRLRTVRVEQLRHYGPALYAPLASKSAGTGVIILLRNIGCVEFNLHDLAMAENAAKQAAIALELAEARLNEELASELDERSRIGRDLHDLAIQQLFASGMHITAVKEDLAAKGYAVEVGTALDQAISSIDESVRQIRVIVQSLRDDSASVALVERLQQETKVALQVLNFAPSLIISWNGEVTTSEDTFALIDDAVGSDISDDVVAVVREGLSNVARHAHASSVAVQLTVDPSHVRIDVIDDGRGIKQSLGRRSGLSNLAARARRHHGSFTISPHTRGTCVSWEAPLM
ncbi:GAF domain-containing protein [Arcanobacterium haemolyticum]|uniref:GAF sensor signal transduction histidine kinase n=1 Tax=Arcanobacterium haemolyticum (strain ATCC 9345 / DSM 20595 / CCM 5947 / CCUG 17215 / LMG 16163 / NBRC 15585 / NCTC 8452 / 11018) TaxID=644284 RepID=D7BPE2_ARCHD|nr:GAF domain-containing protein [Arcanobacterium haemolyticum]ADH92791.1 GAF sensor signal transduction histidine kinase [Arcanobacterium haemolyticum DSM 20595]QCX46882.1 GAF domain-containing protein [Arcanobacterium haemolyticum]SQH28461.1 Redox sensor histidine kinase response regulator devS [Arcanobacterium haemolyticum]